MEPHSCVSNQVLQGGGHNYDWQGSMFEQQLPLKKLFPAIPPFSMTKEYSEGIANLMVSPPNLDYHESAFPIGYAFFKLFVEHDLTYSLYHQMTTGQFGTKPSLALLTLYGGSWQVQPYLFNVQDPAKFLLVEDDQTGRIKLPTNNQDQPLIADTRNMKYPGLEELHILFCTFHNHVVDYLRAKGKRTDVFEEAQKLVRWHYHWLIINDLLPAICSDYAQDQIKNFWPDPRYTMNGIELPVEALLAALRFDDVLLKGFESYRPDDWKDEFLFANNKPYYSSPIHASCSKLDRIHESFPLPQLIEDVGCQGMLSLSQQLGLPSGEALSKVYGVEPLSKNQLGIVELLRDIHTYSDFYELSHIETPLWYYFLKEAEEQENGQKLGKTASYVLIETLQSMLCHDTSSYFLLYPNWQPYFGTTNSSFSLSDMVIFTEIGQKRKSA